MHTRQLFFFFTKLGCLYILFSPNFLVLDRPGFQNCGIFLSTECACIAPLLFLTYCRPLFQKPKYDPLNKIIPLITSQTHLFSFIVWKKVIKARLAWGPADIFGWRRAVTTGGLRRERGGGRRGCIVRGPCVSHLITCFNDFWLLTGFFQPNG